MPKYFAFPIFTMVFALILVATVPQRETKRLAIYGIIFGGMMDSLVHLFGYITGLFSWINYGPFGFLGVHLFPGISWSIFFIIYYYFLPQQKPLNYIFAVAAIFFSTLYYNLLSELDLLYSSSKLWLPLAGFAFWFSTATWGFYKLNTFMECNSFRWNQEEKTKE
ncbi:membrane protein [Desulfosporosinus sp. HMP52]|uniref:hypothetical protein n=1 Tax=Desulfosporosinus sp. HMP52 TaxID=1487923 RepID=UPI00051FB955|nr:hypothetical protein [Desulfosporosinus sp. HMP52]KGK83914.1 membrane protein [Desulfosporosinus sp. HMP52]